MQRNTSHSRVSEIHSSTVTPTHASELVIDRAVGAMMAREAEEKGGPGREWPTCTRTDCSDDNHCFHVFEREDSY